MKFDINKFIYFGIIVFLVFVIFAQRSCVPHDKPVTTKQKVVIPKKVGSFKKPTSIIQVAPKKDSVHWHNEYIKVENPVNKKLADEFIKAQKENDSLKALNLYLNSIGEHNDIYTFENQYAKYSVNAKVRGKILDMTSDYELKETTQKVDVIQKETKFALYSGGGLEYSRELNKLVPKVTVGFQNKLGDVFYLEGGTDNSVQVGYLHRFINIKK